MNTEWVLGILVTVLIATIGWFFRWMDGQFKGLHERVKEAEALEEHRFDQTTNALDELRREVYKDFVRRDDHTKLAANLREDFQIVFKLLHEMTNKLATLTSKKGLKDD